MTNPRFITDNDRTPQERAQLDAKRAMLAEAKSASMRAEIIDHVLIACAMQRQDSYEIEHEDAILAAGFKLLESIEAGSAK